MPRKDRKSKTGLNAHDSRQRSCAIRDIWMVHYRIRRLEQHGAPRCEGVHVSVFTPEEAQAIDRIINAGLVRLKAETIQERFDRIAKSIGEEL